MNSKKNTTRAKNMLFSTKKPLCFEIERELLSSEDRIDVLFFHPNYVESNEKIRSSVYPIFKFSDLIEFMTDGKHGGWNFVKQGILFIRNSNVKEDEIDLSDVKYITKEDHHTTPRAHLKEGDILFTTIGTIGVSAVVNKEIAGANINQNLVRIVLKKEKVIPEFFSIFSNSRFGRLQSERHSTGNIQKIINYPTIKNFLIPLPPKQIQRKIYKIMRDAREWRKRNLEEVQRLRKELDDFFLKVVGLTYPEKKGEMSFTAKLEDRLDPYFYHPKFKQTIDALMEGRFELRKVKDVGDFSNEQIDPKKEPNRLFKYIQIQNIDEENHRIFSYTPILGKEAPGRAKMLIKDGDILLPILGGSLRSVTIVPKKFDNEVATNGFAILRISDKNLRYYIFYYLTTKFAQMQIERQLTGTIMSSISKSELENLLIPLPDSVAQDRVAKKIKEVDVMIKKLQEEADDVIDKAKEEVEKIVIGRYDG